MIRVYVMNMRMHFIYLSSHIAEAEEDDDDVIRSQASEYLAQPSSMVISPTHCPAASELSLFLDADW